MARIVGKLMIDTTTGVVGIEVSDRALGPLLRDQRFEFASPAKTPGHIGRLNVAEVPVYLRERDDKDEKDDN